MQITHIYWFAYFNTTEPSVRYRATFPLHQLKTKHGITYSIVYPGYDFKSISNFAINFFKALLLRKNNSVIVFQKINTNGIYTKALKTLLLFRPKFTIYDIDDAEHTRKPVDTIHHFMKRCSACTVGSYSLLQYAKQFNNSVHLLTSPVIKHGITKSQQQGKFIIGWIGYYGAHRQNLMQLFFPALISINFPVTLKLLGITTIEQKKEIESYFNGNKNITIEAPLDLNWLEETSIYSEIATFHIGVSPLIDNEFNRAKSAFKLKQCLSCGVPVLASSVGENRTFLKDGINGYFCNTPDDYAKKIAEINSMDTKTYHQLSENASHTFPGFSIDKYAESFISIFQ